MLKRKPLILIAVVTALAALFIAPSVMAGQPAPPQYTAPNTTATITVPKTGTFNLSVEMVDATCLDPEGAAVECNNYELTVSGPTGLNTIFITMPLLDSSEKSVNCSIPLSVIQVSPEWKFTTNTDILDGLSDRSVMEWDHNEPILGKWTVGTDSAQLGHGTVCLKVNRYFACTEIAVPDCEIPECLPEPYVGPTIPNDQHECWNIGTTDHPASMSFTRDPVTQYANIKLVESVKFYPTSDCSGTTAYDPDETTALGPNDWCVPGPGKKKECLKVEHHSPGCYYFSSGGYACSYCY
jgi:hypothetical protein